MRTQDLSTALFILDIKGFVSMRQEAFATKVAKTLPGLVDCKSANGHRTHLRFDDVTPLSNSAVYLALTH
jgi:hypothetical protein